LLFPFLSFSFFISFLLSFFLSFSFLLLAKIQERKRETNRIEGERSQRGQVPWYHATCVA
jgi:hypothetical protein